MNLTTKNKNLRSASQVSALFVLGLLTMGAHFAPLPMTPSLSSFQPNPVKIDLSPAADLKTAKENEKPLWAAEMEQAYRAHQAFATSA